MSAWNIYHKDGSKLTDVNGEQITVHGLEYSDSWMGECFLTINFKHEVPINFQIGDYIVYRGERFELNYEPGKDKQARPDTYGEGFVYDSVKFNALQDELARAEFLDVVLNDNELHYTALPKFPFYVQTLDDLLDRIQACLNEQIGAGLWKIYSRNKDRSVQRGALESEWLSVYGEKTDDNVIESMSITVDSQTCWQALALVNEKWDINFIVRGRNIYVGTTGIQANHIFKYGLGNGLYEIVQNADSDQSVVTRLRAYGSEKNLPSHYYADLGVKYVANITKVVGASTYVTLELDLDYIETYFKNPRKYIVSGEEQSFGWVLKVTFDFKTEITGYVTKTYDSKKCRFYSELKGTQTDTGDEESKEKFDAFIAQVKAGNTKMYITSGLNKKAVPSSMKEYTKNLPNNMSINRLMLPGFPHVSLSDFYNSLTNEEKKYVNPTGRQHKFSTDPHRPYIDSINIKQIGLRSASQFFETDDKTNGVIEIYPTIEEMEIGGVRVDEIDEGVAPDDDGRFGDNETVKNVDIYLKKAIDFDINDLKDDDFSISMKDGMCGGRTFKVASSTKIDGRWRLTIERVKDDALELWFPYKDYPIKKGDHFVLTGITLPDSYVNAASLKLLKYAIAFIDKNDYTRYVYQPKVDEIFMARQHDLAEKDTTGVIKSLHDTLKAGDLMEFEDTDLRIGGVISIDQLTIKEEDGKIPTYDITLREDKEVGTIQKIQQQISSLQSGNGGTGAGLTTTQVKNQVATEGSKHFISKINDDTAKGTITWEKVQKFLQGLLVGGGSWTPDAEGRSHLITDYLEVRMKAIFEELVINKTSTIGGKEIISPAGGVVAHKVEEVTVTYNNVSQKAYRCYFLAEQDGDEVDNDFAVNDQVRSESFNVRKGTYHKAGNHFYWRLVIGRDEDPVELEGKKYHYIDLSDTDCATASDVPAKGDVLNQCGNRTDVERQNCLIFSAVDTYSPSISLYHGINSYSFANREYVEYGVNKQNNKAFFNVYGDMYVGDRPTKENGYEGSSYIRYDSSTKQMSVKAKISAKSTVDGKELSQYFKKIGELQNQVDGAIETWFYDGVPTLENAPAISWKTDKDKEIHLGDLYYNNKTGKAYRFAKDSNTYKWTLITDTDIAKALSDARMAQETANGKMKVFSVQPTTPYQVGDIWVNATYPSDGSTYKNEVLRCQTNKAAGSQFAIGDWIKASKYTDDTVANAAKKAAEDAQKAAQTAQTDIKNLGNTVTDNKKEFDNYVTDGYLEPSEIAAMAQDSKRLEDDFAAAQKSYNEVKNAEVLANTKELTDLNTAFATLTSAKTELVTYLSDISKRYNETDTNGKAAIVSAVGTKFTNFQSAYSAFYDKLGLANAYITSKIYGDLKQNITDLAGYKYLKDALGQTTDIDGGLVMTTLLALRDGDGNVQSGINGAIDPNRGKKSIATWWGGQMVDKDYNSGNLTPATSLIRFDGSGYLANGAIWWDVSGKVHADPTSFIISEKNLGAYLTFFEPTWKAGSAGTSVADLVSLKPNAPFSKLGVLGDATFEGSISFHGIKLTYDPTNKAIKIDGNLYTTGGITAYGAGASTTGGGGLIASVISYARILEGSYTDADLTSIPNAYAIKALSSRIDNIATELGGLNLSWNNITGKPSTFAPSAHTHKWTEITDRITKVSQLTNDAGYLTAHQSLASYYTKAEIDAKGYTTNKGTVTSVALILPTGLACATKTITTSGTFAVTFASGYSIPTTTKQSSWDSAVSVKHSHSNKTVLDGITSTKVTNWDSAYRWYSLITTDEETADGIINKWNEVVNFLANIAQTDTLSGIIDGINTSISNEVSRAKKAEGTNASNISANKTSITTLQGYFTSGSAKKALQLTTARNLWGNAFNGTADVNGSIVLPSDKYISIGNIKLEYDATNKALKITNTTTDEVANLYASGGVSAYGVGSVAGSGGGGLNGTIVPYSTAITSDPQNEESKIASASSIYKLHSRISAIENNGATSITVTGTGNAITSVSKNGTSITFTKGATFLTSHQSLANYYTKSSVDSLLSGKSATSHTHSVKINGVTKTIAATGGTAVDLGTYLTSHQSLNGYATQSWVKSQGYLTSHQDVSVLTMANDRYYTANQWGINMRNSDIIGVNSIYTNDVSESPIEAILFCRRNGNYDGIRAVDGVLYFSDNVVRTTKKYTAEYKVYHTGNLTKLSQLTNDKNFVTGSVSGQTITINGVSTTWQNTWRGITDSYSGTSTGTSLSQKGANSLYNALHNGYASSAGNSDTVDGYHASGLLTALSNSNNGISITVGGTTKSISNISVNHASNADTATTSSMLKTANWFGAMYVSSDTHYMCLGYMNCTDSYDSLTLLVTSAFWGNQHGSQDIITIQQSTNTDDTARIQTNVGRLRLGGSYERSFYYYKDDSRFRLYLYVYVIGGNSYGRWNISYLGGNATWVTDHQENVTKSSSWIGIGYSAQVNYASSAGNADTVDGYHASSFLIDRGGNYTGLLYDLPCKSIFSGVNLSDAPTTGWVSGIVLGSNWNSSHHQHYLVEVGSRWYATRISSNGKMTNWNTFAYLTDNVASATKLKTARNLWGNAFNGTADVNGSIVLPSDKYISIGNIKLEYDATNKALKITNTTTDEVANLYASGGVSAYGVGSVAGSGGGGLNGTIVPYSTAITSDPQNEESKIASASSIYKLHSRISAIENNGATSITVTGTGNAITSVSKNGTSITFTKGATFLTSHQSLANYYTKSSVDSLLSGKSATSHTHSVKINGVTKTIAATGGTAVDLGTYLTSHQSLNGYATQSWVKSQGYLTSHQDVSVLTMANDRYYTANQWGINMRNSDIIGVNSIYTNDVSESPIEAILFCRRNGNYDGIRAVDGVLYFSDNVVRTTKKYTAEYKVYHTGNLTKLSQLTNDKNFVTGSVSGQTITINGVSTTWQNTWRGITDSYSGTSTGTSLSQKGANSLYNALHNGYASSAGNSDTVDGYHASGLLTALSNSNNGISITVGGTTKSISNISVNHASNADTATTSSMLKTANWFGAMYVSSDTHYMCLGYMNCTDSYDSLTLLVTSAFWGNQHGSQDIITIQQSTNTDDTARIQTNVGRLRLGGSYERSFYYYKDDSRFRLYLYVYVIGGNSYGRWNISYLGGNATWVTDHQENVTKSSSWIGIGYSAQVNYASSAGNADTVDGYHASRRYWFT